MSSRIDGGSDFSASAMRCCASLCGTAPGSTSAARSGSPIASTCSAVIFVLLRSSAGSPLTSSAWTSGVHAMSPLRCASLRARL
jgi:hypothetical protein